MTTPSPMDVTEDEKHHWLGKFAFAALIALRLAYRDGKIPRNPQAENVFLLRWLQTALKQKRFHRCVALDLAWLINLGQHRLMTSKLKFRLEYLWRSCCCDIASQSDLFHLTTATEVLKNLGWDSIVLRDAHWDNMLTTKPHQTAIPIFYVAETALTAGFNEEGQHLQTVAFWVLGLATQFNAVMKQHHLHGEFDDGVPCYRLLPSH